MANIKQFECKGCKKKFGSSSGRSKHHKMCELVAGVVNSYIKTADGKYKCATCNLVMVQQSNMCRHVKRQHQKEKMVKE